MTPAERLRAALARVVDDVVFGRRGQTPGYAARWQAEELLLLLLADPDFEAALAEALWASGYVASGQSLGRVIIERLRA